MRGRGGGSNRSQLAPSHVKRKGKAAIRAKKQKRREKRAQPSSN